MPIYIDSPLAVEATKVFVKNSANFDTQASALVMQGDNPFQFANLTYVESVEESRALNTSRCGRIIISSSGMATAGRVRHHLKHNLWDENSAVVLVGYQAKGTLGRLLLEGINEVKLFGEDIAVRAKVYTLPGFSAHADEPMLLSFIDSMPRKPKEIYLVHGEEDQQNALKTMIEKKWNIPVKIAERGERVSIKAEEKQRKAICEEEVTELEDLYDRVNKSAENLKHWKKICFDRTALKSDIKRFIHRSCKLGAPLWIWASKWVKKKMTEILKGKPVAEEVRERILRKVRENKENQKAFGLAVLRVGNDESDLSYERSLKKNCAKLAIPIKSCALPDTATTDDVVREIERLNKDPEITGILVFRPLSKGIDDTRVRLAVAPEKMWMPCIRFLWRRLWKVTYPVIFRQRLLPYSLFYIIMRLTSVGELLPLSIAHWFLVAPWR